MKHKIKPTGKMRAVSIYADGTSLDFVVIDASELWNNKGCNRALSDCVRKTIQRAKSKRSGK